MAELAGRETGLCRGRGGSMHLTSGTAGRAVMATGIVGGTLAIAVGHALAQSQGDVVVVFFGDGAVQNGAFHESLNMAALWKAPVLFVCENNGWVEFSSREEHTTVDDVARYGELYGFPAQQVDGSDVEAVVAAAESLLVQVRSGISPALLECSIGRLRPHYEGDLRQQDTARDPLLVTEAALVAAGVDSDELTQRRAGRLVAAMDVLASVLATDPFPDPADDPGLVFARALG
jgi:pyruvate dehydrogenase E1 component alpha subunit